MKYIVILGDGMADRPVKELENKTPLQYANIPTIDYMAKNGEVGIVKTIPDGMPPGSDTANLSVIGYEPEKYYTGRSPLEAVSMGVKLKDTDVTFRCNLVTLSDEENYSEKTMLDHSSDEISTEESKEIIKDLSKYLETEDIKFYSGVSYRHLIVWSGVSFDFKLTPPHDILGRKITDYLPEGSHKETILNLMIKSSKFLKNHPVNLNRIKKGLRPANSIWIWGEGRKPSLTSFYDKYHVKGSVISAVDLIKGIGISANLRSVDVDGATGNINTNFEGKAKAAMEELKNGQDFVYVHIEAPDECGHRFEIQNKVKSIELIDNKVVKYIKENLDEMGEEYRMLILPDHPTPLCLRTHTEDPVPFLIYESNKKLDGSANCYNEFSAKESGIYFDAGPKLMKHFLKKQ